MKYKRILLNLLFPAMIFAQNLCVDGQIIHSIRYEGLQHTRAEVVIREQIHKIETPFANAQFLAEQSAWQDLDLFADIQVFCTVDSAQKMVLTYQFKELFQYLPAPALKQSDQDGWMAGGALAALNLLGWDIRAEFQARFTVQPWMQAKEFAFYASSPYLIHWPIKWRGEYVKVDSWDPLRGYIENSHNVELEIEPKLHRNWSALVHGSFRQVNHAGQDSLAWLGKNVDYAPKLILGLIWDNRDAQMNTQKGVYSEWSVGQNGGVLGGTSNSLEMLWDFEWTQKAPFEIGIVKLGWLARVRPGEVGFYDRYQQGGANTLRGFVPDSARHGNSEIIWNAEWRKTVLRRTSFSVLGVNAFGAIDVVGGVDGAWLWEQEIPSWDDYQSSIYGGIHLVVPAINRIRLELGINPADKNWAFTVGLFEKRITQRWRSR